MLYGILAVLTALTFLVDLFVPLGIAVGVIYLVPTALAYLVWRPHVPLALAGGATILTLMGLVFSSPGVDPEVARINRGFGVLTVWITAITAYFFIRNKLAVRKQEWSQAGQVSLAQNMGCELRLDQLGENILHFWRSIWALRQEHFSSEMGMLSAGAPRTRCLPRPRFPITSIWATG